jgi:hypothetical protein
MNALASAYMAIREERFLSLCWLSGSKQLRCGTTLGVTCVPLRSDQQNRRDHRRACSEVLFLVPSVPISRFLFLKHLCIWVTRVLCCREATSSQSLGTPTSGHLCGTWPNCPHP